MPLPLLVPAAVLGASLLLGRLRDLRAAESGSQDPPGGTGPGGSYQAGEAPPAPWRSDLELGNGADCGWREGGHPEHANSHALRWLNRQKGMTLPRGVENYSVRRIRDFLLSWTAGRVPAALTGNVSFVSVAAELDVMLGGCLGEKFLAGLKKSPSKIGAWVEQQARGAASATSDVGQKVSDAATSVFHGISL